MQGINMVCSDQNGLRQARLAHSFENLKGYCDAAINTPFA